MVVCSGNAFPCLPPPVAKASAEALSKGMKAGRRLAHILSWFSAQGCLLQLGTERTRPDGLIIGLMIWRLWVMGSANLGQRYCHLIVTKPPVKARMHAPQLA